jgi:tRNA A37 threonylcarbamoyladenosine modification protein TsaB
VLRGRLAVLTHARHGLVYAQVFSAPGLSALSAPEVISVDALDLLVKTKTPLFVLGSGVRRNMPRIVKILPQAEILDQVWDHPRAEQLVQAAQRACFSQTPIEPLYLRSSDAEDNLEAIARKRGLDLQEARQYLSADMPRPEEDPL